MPWRAFLVSFQTPFFFYGNWLELGGIDRKPCVHGQGSTSALSLMNHHVVMGIDVTVAIVGIRVQSGGEPPMGVGMDNLKTNVVVLERHFFEFLEQRFVWLLNSVVPHGSEISKVGFVVVLSNTSSAQSLLSNASVECRMEHEEYCALSRIVRSLCNGVNPI